MDDPHFLDYKWKTLLKIGNLTSLLIKNFSSFNLQCEDNGIPYDCTNNSNLLIQTSLGLVALK